MGVAWVFETELNKTAVERILESNGADYAGTFSVDSIPYVPTEKHQLEIACNYILHHSNFPQTTFSIAAADTYKRSPRAICDRGFDLILGKMRNGCSPDQLGKFEVKGSEYTLNDFTIRVGNATQVSAFKGVIVEVEYRASSVVSQCRELLVEFMRTLFMSSSEQRPDAIEQGNPENYSPIDTMWQYLTIFRTLRKKT
ncbi:unnamed protein product [Caenorhabditis bovis]|uniref:Mediator of RNA polymerase II transcription subunit 20 n=1 Tax=Caenorhabditis bovis TaxID=2654633 RepID=A0A8S1F1I8_9PELO|nr:unnamed protein product [Caenorhabditis bovis]